MTRTARLLLLILVALMLLAKFAEPVLSMEDAKQALGEMLEREKKCGGFFAEHAHPQAWKDFEDGRFTDYVALFDHGWAILLREKKFEYYHGITGLSGEFVYSRGEWKAQATIIGNYSFASPSQFQ